MVFFIIMMLFDLGVEYMLKPVKENGADRGASGPLSLCMAVNVYYLVV